MDQDLKGVQDDQLIEVKLSDGSSYYVSKGSLQSVSVQEPTAAPAKADDQNLIRGVTPNGFNFCLNKRKINDMAFIEALSKVENDDDPANIVALFDQILGEEQKRRLYEFCKEPDGVIPIEKCANEFAAILQAAGNDVKKS